MKKVWKIVGIATLVAILGLATVGAVAYAQEEDDGYPFDFVERFKEAIADVLGISVEEFDAAVEQAQERVVDEAVDEGWLTEEQAELYRWRMDQAPSFGMPGMGKGFHGLDRSMPGPGNSLLSVAAETMDMSLTDLLDELQDGKSIADVAEEAGVATDDIVEAYLAGVQENLDEAVAEGRITQNQADYRLEQAEERVTAQLDATWSGGFRGFGRPGRGMRAFPGQSGF
jgi:energy-converting hydrogenase A subunit M